MTDLSPAYHYQVIARALDVIDAEGPALTLDSLAQRMTMSPAHFQRVFSQWVGVSPKRYQQYLTLGHARGRYGTTLEQRTGKRLMINFSYRFSAQSRALKAQVDAGTSGDFYFGRTVWHRRRGMPGFGGWFGQKALAGEEVIIANAGSYGAVGVSFSPNASDMVEGADITAADNKDLINTKATAARQDFAEIDYSDANGWVARRRRGVWAREA